MRWSGWSVGLALFASVATAQDAPRQPAPVQPPDPDTEALALALELTKTGPIAALLPVMVIRETEALIEAHPDWTPAERQRFRAIAETTFAAGRDRLFAAMARQYVERLTLAELRQLVAMSRYPVSVKLREVEARAILTSTQVVESMNFRRDTLEAFCRETGKGCEKK